MAEPVPFEPLIKGVPADSLKKQFITPVATKINVAVDGAVSAGGNDLMYEVPAHYVLEIKSIFVSMTNISAPVADAWFSMQFGPNYAGSPAKLITSSHIATNDCKIITQEFGDLSVFVRPREKIWIYAGGGNRISAILFGNLIKIDDLVTKFGIFF